MKKELNPLALILLSIFAILTVVNSLIMLVYIPQSAELFAHSFNGELSNPVKIVLSISNMYQRVFILTLPVTIALFVGLIVLVKKLGKKIWVSILLLILILIQLCNILFAVGSVELEKKNISISQELQD